MRARIGLSVGGVPFTVGRGAGWVAAREAAGPPSDSRGTSLRDDIRPIPLIS